VLPLVRGHFVGIPFVDHSSIVTGG
jgi:hypothetical protein